MAESEPTVLEQRLEEVREASEIKSDLNEETQYDLETKVYAAIADRSAYSFRARFLKTLNEKRKNASWGERVAKLNNQLTRGLDFLGQARDRSNKERKEYWDKVMYDAILNKQNRSSLISDIGDNNIDSSLQVLTVTDIFRKVAPELIEHVSPNIVITKQSVDVRRKVDLAYDLGDGTLRVVQLKSVGQDEVNVRQIVYADDVYKKGLSKLVSEDEATRMLDYAKTQIGQATRTDSNRRYRDAKVYFVAVPSFNTSAVGNNPFGRIREDSHLLADFKEYAEGEGFLPTVLPTGGEPK